MIYVVSIGTVRSMSDIHSIISEIDEYCAKSGLSPATVCNRARNNARLYERLKSRARRHDEDVAGLRNWMSANPAPKPIRTHE